MRIWLLLAAAVACCDGLLMAAAPASVPRSRPVRLASAPRSRPVCLVLAPSQPPDALPLSRAERYAAVSTALPLRIDGVWYDCGPWADQHPGGRWLLEYARGRDVTALFYATHMIGEGAATSALRKLPTLDPSLVPMPSRAGLSPSALAREAALQGPYVVALDPSTTSPLPPIDTPLRRDLQSMLRRRFPSRAAAKATPAHWTRVVCFGVLCASCWVGWLRFDPLAVALLPFAQWLLASHTVHEATHGALSTDPRVNFWLQFTSHPILFNVFVWIPQHILSHHQYTNDPQHDVDVHHFAGARLARSQPRYSARASGSCFNEGWTFAWKGCLRLATLQSGSCNIVISYGIVLFPTFFVFVVFLF